MTEVLEAVTGRPPASVPGASELADVLALLKPRVMSLVVVTGVAGLVAAPATLHPVLAVAAIVAIALAAGAAGAINMWYDRDIDAVMERTRRRPLPAGRLQPADALALGVVLTIAAAVLMSLAANWVAVALLLLATVWYVFVYTIWLKRRTPYNIVVGGAAGAFPPMIGWAAATGTVDWPAVVLFGLIVLWTPPHFWALALTRAADYRRAGVPMLPVTAGDRATRRQIFGYALVLWPVALLPWVLGIAGVAYLITAAAVGTAFVWLARAVCRGSEPRAAQRMFAFSILYLFLLFSVLIAENTPMALR